MSHPHRPENPPPPAPPPPPRDPASTLIAAGLVPIIMSAAAAATSIWCQDNMVSRTAWVVVAVVGTATMISAAVSLRPPARRCHPPRPETDQESGTPHAAKHS